jgi:hypothetical protein
MPPVGCPDWKQAGGKTAGATGALRVPNRADPAESFGLYWERGSFD